MKLNPLTTRLAASQALARQFMAGRAGFAPGMVMHGNAVIGKLEDERAGQFAFIDKLTADVEAAGRDLSDTERANVEAAHKRVKEIDEQLKPLREFEELRETHQSSTSRYTGAGDQGDRPPWRRRPGRPRRPWARVRGQRAGAQVPVGRGVPRGHLPGQPPGAARRPADRPQHVRGVRGAAPVARSDRRGRQPLIRASAPHNTTAEVPGLLPHTIVGEIMSDVDAARPFITSVGARDLGGIPGLTFERPTITQHVQVAKQSAEKATVANRQFEVEGIPFTKDTYGGWANVSRQSIDWTCPGVWDALMTDFVEQYGLETEDDAADAFAAAVTQTQALGTSTTIAAATMQELLVALYAAAGKAYQGSGRLPDTIWAGLDWWAVLGPLIDHLKATTAGDGGGDSSVSTFSGNLLRVNRVIVPSFPAETLIVGTKSRTEVYEDRFGFLSVVEPKVFGVEIAYGGYMASGTVKPGAFCKIVKKPA